MAAIWLGAALLAALGLGAVVAGVRKRGAPSEAPSAAALFAARRQEIAAEAEAGSLGAEQVAALEEELALDLLDGTPATATAPTPARPAPSLTARAIGAVAVAALALGLYAWWGDPSAPALVASFNHIAPDDQAALTAFASKLSARAKRRPDDLNTWLLLARVWMRLENHAEAAAAFAAAHAIAGADKQLDLAWVQARFLADGGVLTPASREIAARVLAQSPSEPALLELLAMGELRLGAYAAAAPHLVALLRQALPPSRRQVLAAALALARERQDPNRPHVAVDIAVDGLAAETPAPWLMVLARPPGGGPPVAVARLPAQARQTVLLDDANAMVAANPLSGSAEVEIVARLSNTGAASDSDAEAISPPVAPAAKPQVRLRLAAGPAGAADTLGVTVDVSIAETVAPATPVFVIARAAPRPAPPVAVRRLTAGDLPARVTLTAADAMLPAAKLSALVEVEVVARASLSGAAGARPGDLESASARVRVGAGDYAQVARLRIDTPVR